MNSKSLMVITVTMVLASLVGARARAALIGPQQGTTYPASQVKTIAAIGQDIANLKAQFPQLREFSVSKNVLSKRLIVTYGYHTHRSQITGGWRAQVPEPDDDGVWFYIDFHDPASTDQIHTQPMLPSYCFEDKKVLVLIMDGKETKPTYWPIWTILKRHGIKRCGGGPF